MVGNMREQNACLIPIEAGPLQYCAEAIGVYRTVVMYAHNLQAIEEHFFVVQHMDTRAAHCIEVVRRVRKFFVVSGHEIGSDSCGELFPWCSELVRIHLGSVVQVTGDEDNVRSQPLDHSDNAPHESDSVDGAKMDVGDERGHTATPGYRK